jgi:hypothetical protein
MMSSAGGFLLLGELDPTGSYVLAGSNRRRNIAGYSWLMNGLHAGLRRWILL